MTHAPESRLGVGQNLTVIFSCLDVDNRIMNLKETDSVSYIVITDKASHQSFTGQISARREYGQLQNIQQFVIQELMQTEGIYSLTIYHQNAQMPQKRVVYQLWDGIRVENPSCYESEPATMETIKLNKIKVKLCKQEPNTSSS